MMMMMMMAMAFVTVQCRQCVLRRGSCMLLDGGGLRAKPPPSQDRQAEPCLSFYAGVSGAWCPDVPGKVFVLHVPDWVRI